MVYTVVLVSSPLRAVSGIGVGVGVGAESGLRLCVSDVASSFVKYTV